jgi:hypothetical protein
VLSGEVAPGRVNARSAGLKGTGWMTNSQVANHATQTDTRLTTVTPTGTWYSAEAGSVALFHICRELCARNPMKGPEGNPSPRRQRLPCVNNITWESAHGMPLITSGHKPFLTGVLPH